MTLVTSVQPTRCAQSIKYPIKLNKAQFWLQDLILLNLLNYLSLYLLARNNLEITTKWFSTLVHSEINLRHFSCYWETSIIILCVLNILLNPLIKLQILVWIQRQFNMNGITVQGWNFLYMRTKILSTFHSKVLPEGMPLTCPTLNKILSFQFINLQYHFIIISSEVRNDAL